MKVYLACPFETGLGHSCKDVYVLESFYYLKQEFVSLLPKCKDVLVDSGAFTFMNSQNKSNSIDFDDYARKYASFLEKNKIKHYFELDIDVVKGISYVEEIRRYLEKTTGIPSIPVWHKSRGIDYFKKMCNNYPYIAIGGLAIKDIKRSEYQKLIPMVNYAHANGCKIHGLGFTNMQWLSKIHWDSVDSTNWLSGSRFGQIHRFDDSRKKIVQIKKPVNTRIKTQKREELNKSNLNEWIKFQRYAELNL